MSVNNQMRSKVIFFLMRCCISDSLLFLTFTTMMPPFGYLLLTWLLELPVVYLFYKKQGRYALVVAALLSLFTWPLLHLLLYNYRPNLHLLEAGVALVEGLGLWLLLGRPWYKAWGVAILANGISYGAGLLIDFLS
jgi:hypothetical protein